MIAALFVAAGGCYFGLPNVDPWDEARDARLYAGPHPVVAHPPCARWGSYWYGGPLLHRQGRRKKLGDDGGCFAAALSAVLRFGGVLEHPAHSRAWRAFGLPIPSASGGWTGSLLSKGFSAAVEQGNYGHRAPKATWLFCNSTWLPSLKWGPSGAVGRVCDNHRMRPWSTKAGRLGQRERLATPTPFRDLLISIAEGGA